MPGVLVTGFEPFGGETLNPSALVALSLDGKRIHEQAVVGRVLPCAFDTAPRLLREHLREHEPELVICLGEAGGRGALSLERVALNLDDARIPDNAGARPSDRPVILGGPAAYWSSLPLKPILHALVREQLPAELSNTAGSFVCNHVFYRLMHGLKRKRAVRGGFIHLPYLPEQVKSKPGVPALELAQAVRGIELAIAVCLTSP